MLETLPPRAPHLSGHPLAPYDMCPFSMRFRLVIIQVWLLGACQFQTLRAGSGTTSAGALAPIAASRSATIVVATRCGLLSTCA
jgi:hypothetical protein